MGQNGQIPSILEIFCPETLFWKNIVIYHFFWYSSLVSLSTIFFNLPWHNDMENWIKKIKNWPLSTRALWARVLYVVPESINLGYHFVLATYFIWTSLLTLSIFWNPAYPHSHSLLSHHSFSQSPSHSHNLAINSLWLSQSRYQTLPHALNLPFSLPLGLALLLSLLLALLLTLSVSLSLCIFSLESQGMSHSVCIFSLSIGYLWVFVGICISYCLHHQFVVCCLFLFLILFWHLSPIFFFSILG